MARKLLIAAYVFLGGFGICCFLANRDGATFRGSASATRRPAVAVRLVQAPAAQTEKAKKAGDQLETAPAISDGGLGTVPPPRKFTWTELENEFARLRSERKERPEAMHELSAWYEHVADPKFTQSKDYLEHIERLKSWHDEKPDSSTRLVVLAKSYIGFAWNARGTGFAGTVTDEGWELFHGRVAEARRLLDQAIDKGVKDGEAYALLIEIAKVEGRPKEEALEWPPPRVVRILVSTRMPAPCGALNNMVATFSASM